MDNGFGSDRRLVMHNDFILVRPEDRSGGHPGADAPWRPLKAIEAAGGTFVTRGDDSGTHKKELDLWKKAGLDPAGRPGTSRRARAWAPR